MELWASFFSSSGSLSMKKWYNFLLDNYIAHFSTNSFFLLGNILFYSLFFFFLSFSQVDKGEDLALQ
ncbi:hypothetical protein IC575_025487 [Cucumis melo]